MNISYKYLTAWLLMAATALVSCSDDNDDGKSASDNGQPTIEELAEMAAADRQEAASCVIRALAGLDELPDNWETATLLAFALFLFPFGLARADLLLLFA